MPKWKYTPAPEEHDRPLPIGCLYVSIAWGLVFIVIAIAFRSGKLAVPAVLAVPGIVMWTQELVQRLRMIYTWHRRGILGLLVYSESPHWQAYVEQEWLPKFSDQLLVLDWSNRRSWGKSLETALFNWYLGHDWNFNPAIVLSRGMRKPLIFRFYYTFRDAKHGNLAALERLERRLFEELNLDYSGCTYTSFQKRMLESASSDSATLERGS